MPSRYGKRIFQRAIETARMLVIGQLEGSVRSRFPYLIFVIASFGLAFLVSGIAQVKEKPPLHGYPQDWTHRHIVFSRKSLSSLPQLAAIEPRVLQQALRQAEPYLRATWKGIPSGRLGESFDGTGRDWNVALGIGRVNFGMSPAKYGFDPSAPPSCSDDFVTFGLNVAGVTGGQANMVAFNNLYSGSGGICTGPTILFAYNTTTGTNGRVMTSPVLSLDGTKIAFVESATSQSIFHVLTWATGTGNGTSATNSAVPGVGNTASMTSLTYATTTTDTRSSPWIDYINDVAYVASDNGKLYKITGVFNGTPALAGAPWPVTIFAGRHFTGAVLDQFTGNLFLGDGQGVLYSLNAANPTGSLKSLAVGLSGQRNPAILDAPIVDASDGTLFAISSNDGTSAVIVQADTATLTSLTKVRLGQGSTAGTNVNLYDGAFDNNYFNDPSTGTMFVCGTGAADNTPRGYTLNFTGKILNPTPLSQTQLLTSARSRCSPISEFFNPNIGVGGTDFFFLGLTADCLGANTSGCIMARPNPGTVITLNETGGTSVIITDNTSTLGQASSLYFTNQGGNPARAVKLTQNGLQ